MVVKLIPISITYFREFESSVISYGSKTPSMLRYIATLFESSVISYGSKTTTVLCKKVFWFESSVISYGSKTPR